MRQISSDLATVQQVRSPRARVSVTVQNRGQNPSVPPLVWNEVVSNSGQSVFRVTTAVGLANGNILKFQANVGAIQMYTVSNPHLAASWSGLSATTLVSTTALGLAAVRIPNSSTIRLWYINSSNNVQYIESSNNGSSWGSAVTVYSGGAAVLDLVVSYISNGTVANGPWFFGFTTQSAGRYTPRFGYHDGSSWVTHAYDIDWRAAGIDAYGDATTYHRCLVVKTRTIGASKLRLVEKSGATFSNAVDLDQTQAGYFGVELAYYRFCQLPELGCMLGVAGESAFGGGIHLGVAGLFSAGEVLADEPIMFPSDLLSYKFYNIANISKLKGMSQKQSVNLNAEQRSQLEEMIHKGESSAREQTRARILLLSDRSQGQQRTQSEIAAVLLCSAATVGNIRRRFLREGLAAALSEKPRPGKPPKVTGEVEAHLIAIACSAPPKGHVRWTLRMLADRLVELEQVESISHVAIRDVLKKMNLSLGR